MNQSQLNSAIRSGLKILGGILTAHGATSAAGLVNTEDLIGLALIVGGAIWSHFHHSDPGSPPPPGIAAALFLALAMGLTAAGCATVFTGIVTVTKVVDNGMTQWAHLSNTHQTSAATDAAVVAAHDRYRLVCRIAQASLVAYQSTRNPADLTAAISQAKLAAVPLIDLIATLLQPTQGAALKQSLAKASAP